MVNLYPTQHSCLCVLLITLWSCPSVSCGTRNKEYPLGYFFSTCLFFPPGPFIFVLVNVLFFRVLPFFSSLYIPPYSVQLNSILFYLHSVKSQQQSPQGSYIPIVSAISLQQSADKCVFILRRCYFLTGEFKTCGKKISWICTEGTDSTDHAKHLQYISTVMCIVA